MHITPRLKHTFILYINFSNSILVQLLRLRDEEIVSVNEKNKYKIPNLNRQSESCTKMSAGTTNRNVMFRASRKNRKRGSKKTTFNNHKKVCCNKTVFPEVNILSFICYYTYLQFF